MKPSVFSVTFVIFVLKAFEDVLSVPTTIALWTFPAAFTILRGRR